MTPIFLTISEEKYLWCGWVQYLTICSTFSPKIGTVPIMKSNLLNLATALTCRATEYFSVLRLFCLGEQCPKSYLIALQTLLRLQIDRIEVLSHTMKCLPCGPDPQRVEQGAVPLSGASGNPGQGLAAGATCKVPLVT